MNQQNFDPAFDSDAPSKDTSVTDAFAAAQAERDDPTASLLSPEEKPTVADSRLFGTPGLSLGHGCWRTTAAYIE